jgi:hypothetical protein
MEGVEFASSQATQQLPQDDDATSPPAVAGIQVRRTISNTVSRACILVFSLFFCRLYTQSLIILMIMPRPKGPRNQGLLKKDLELESLGSTRGLSA